MVASTKDHKPYDEREMARIVDAGGYISMKRVDGDLAVVRADAAPVMGRHRDQATTCVTFYRGRCEVLYNFTLARIPSLLGRSRDEKGRKISDAFWVSCALSGERCAFLGQRGGEQTRVLYY